MRIKEGSSLNEGRERENGSDAGLAVAIASVNAGVGETADEEDVEEKVAEQVSQIDRFTDETEETREERKKEVFC
jgi:hypothetical protein